MILQKLKPARVGLLGVLLLTIGCAGEGESIPAGEEDALATAVKALTGARTRIVWVRDLGDNRDVGAQGNDLLLMAWDSEDGRGACRIFEERGNYHKPLITPRGDRIVFSNVPEGSMHVVRWDGTELRTLGKGLVLDVWQDPNSGEEWVYFAEPRPVDDRGSHERVRRMRLDGDSGQAEPVWDRTPVSAETFQLSRDGTKAAGLFPWPRAGVARLPNGGWQQFGNGCWTAMAPDDSGVVWVFDGQHRNLLMQSPEDGLRWSVNIAHGPGLDGHEVYHPRWSNHPRFIALTGPYKIRVGPNSIRGGGPDVEIYLARFSEDLREIDGWARITSDDRADFAPDVWVAGGEKVTLEETLRERRAEEFAALRAVGSPDDTSETWPPSRKGLVFLWENARAANEIRTADGGVRNCTVEPRGLARYGCWYDMRTRGGAFEAVGQADELLDACRGTNELAVEAVVTSLRGGQKGPARIVSFSRDPGSRNFTLAQENDHLIFRLRTPKTGENGSNPQTRLSMLEIGVPQHVIVTYRDGMLAWYVNGEPAGVTHEVAGDFSNWEPQTLIFGNEATGDRNWDGALEGVALYSRFIGAEEARKHWRTYRKRLEGREPPARYVARGVLLETTATPDPRDIAPYRRALAVYLYRLEPGSGIDEDRVLVAHWVVMDGKALPFAREKGKTYDLILEPYDEHPELEGERLILDTDEIDLPLYLDAAG